MEAAAKAPADGYTIYLGNIGTIAINPAVFQNLSLNPQKDFIAITLVAGRAEHPDRQPERPGEHRRRARGAGEGEAGRAQLRLPGSSSLNRLEMERFMKLANLNIVHIPYKGGAGPAVTGMLGGETQVMFVTLSSAISFIQAGRLKALGISTSKADRGLAAGADDGRSGISGDGQQLVAGRIRSRGDAAPDRRQAPCGVARDAWTRRRSSNASPVAEWTS